MIGPYPDVRRRSLRGVDSRTGLGALTRASRGQHGGIAAAWTWAYTGEGMGRSFAAGRAAVPRLVDCVSASRGVRRATTMVRRWVEVKVLDVTSQLTAGQRALLQTELLRRQHQLDRQFADHHDGLSRVEHARELLSQDSDDVKHRDAEREMDLRWSDRDLAELGAVSAALLRLNEGRYGKCVDCAAAIAFDRLKVEPAALRCIECEARRERAGRG